MIPVPKFRATALEIGAIGAAFDATPERIRIASRRAIAYATKWANDMILGQMPELTGVRARIIAGRVHLEIREQSGKVWFGFNPISAGRLDPQQTSSGVTADGFQFPGAFVVDSLEGNVFKRRGRGRLPIDKQEVTIAEKAEIEVRQIASHVGEQFMKSFKNQLQWMSK